MRGENGFGDGDVVGCGDLDVLAIALDKGNLVAVTLHDGSIVGKAVVVGLTIGGLQQLNVEGLWGLHQTIVATRNGHRTFSFQVAHGFYDGNNGNNGFRRAGCLETTTDNLDAGEGTHTIMHTYHPLCIIRNQRKAVLHGVESRLSTIRQ